MNYRLEDLLRFIIPGLYAVALAFICYMMYNNVANAITKIKAVSNIVLLLIPFVGFVVGFFIECCMSFIEHIFYFLGGRRPSKTILKGSNFYVVRNLDRIKLRHRTNSQTPIENVKFSNNESNNICQEAKQAIDMMKVDNFRIQAIMSRNLFGSQILTNIWIFLLYHDIYSTILGGYSLVAFVIFGVYWIHQNHVYIKYVLAEYAKLLPEVSTNNQS